MYPVRNNLQCIKLSPIGGNLCNHFERLYDLLYDFVIENSSRYTIFIFEVVKCNFALTRRAFFEKYLITHGSEFFTVTASPHTFFASSANSSHLQQLIYYFQLHKGIDISKE